MYTKMVHMIIGLSLVRCIGEKRKRRRCTQRGPRRAMKSSRGRRKGTCSGRFAANEAHVARGRRIGNVFMQPASQVLPFLYVGSQANAADKKLLRSLKIEKLLCVKEMNYAPDPEGIDLMFIPMSDDGSTSLDSVLSQCFDFIKKSRELEKGLLVYCRGGVNRSPTVVLAFLMRSEMMTLKESFDLVKKVRPQITPCLAYIRQLLEIERRLFGKVTLNESEQPSLLSLEERVERWRKQKERRSSTGSGSKGFLQSVREVFHW
ncbi:dual specificity protein phosphatase 5-like [Schistocerca gregaria]|uniref:dual specificity protein phosphatase 5-like n=1 Tax=Schistocerca gregaria TaxID=7010 RepID=UPI00211E1422|nr:dual specificity protein phosphatase 5-like [Schistocerca gregaria]